MTIEEADMETTPSRRSVLDEVLPDDVLPAKYESGLVWHYTRADGALGILREKALFATAMYLQNDSAEVKYEIHLIEQQCATLQDGGRTRSNHPLDSCSKIAGRILH